MFLMNSIIPNNNNDKKFNLAIDKFFKFIFMLVFSGKNLFRTLDTENSLEFSKDVVYRFLNSPNLIGENFCFCYHHHNKARP